MCKRTTKKKKENNLQNSKAAVTGEACALVPRKSANKTVSQYTSSQQPWTVQSVMSHTVVWILRIITFRDSFCGLVYLDQGLTNNH